MRKNRLKLYLSIRQTRTISKQKGIGFFELEPYLDFKWWNKTHFDFRNYLYRFKIVL